MPSSKKRHELLTSAIETYESAIGGHHSPNPILGLILGTGMGGVADELQEVRSIPYGSIPGFYSPTIEGHAGELLAGKLAGRPVLAFNGRCHYYEGRTTDQIQFPIRFLHRLGIRQVLIGNASGGINRRFKSGEVMLIEDHLDLLFRPSIPAAMGELKTENRNISRDVNSRVTAAQVVSPYSAKLNLLAEQTAIETGLVLRKGVYAALTGPNYETRSEYRMLAKLGADAVGMSTVPEAQLAFELGMSVCGLSTITNVANPDQIQQTSHEEVIAAVKSAETTLRSLILGLVSRLPSL